MKTITMTNEKGNVASAVRTATKASVVSELKRVLGDAVVETPKGLAIPVAIDFRTQKTIYAVIDPTITMDVEAKPRKSKAPVEKDPVVIEFELK